MLKIREMYKSPPPSEHYFACLLAGASVAVTSSVFLIVAGEAYYVLLIVPAILAISLTYARHLQTKGVRLRGRGAMACTMVNLMVLAVLIMLFR